MDVASELEAVRTDIDGCDVAALVDVSTGMVLATAQGVRAPQEELDLLSAQAREALAGPVADSVGGIVGPAPIREAILATVEANTVVIRGADDRHEALVCVCSTEASAGDVLESGRRALDRILAEL